MPGSSSSKETNNAPPAYVPSAIPSRLARLFTILLLPLLLTACPQEDKSTALIWTNRAEFASYIELFNSSHSTHRVIVEYVEDPARAFREVGPGPKAPDIVIADNLSTEEMKKNFATLEELFNNGLLDEDRFYSRLISQGIYERQHVVLPISFSLPMFVFDAEDSPDSLSPFFITLNRLRELSVEFNKEDEHGLEKLGLSPLWEEEVLFTATLLFGADYHTTKTGLPAWNGSAVEQTIEFMHGWVQDDNGGLAKAREFSDKFLYEPPYMLIDNGRIRFYYHDIASFFAIPPKKRDHLDYRWPAKDEKIPVPPSILYMGVPHGAGGIATAKEFISWFFRTETQQKLLAASDYKRVRSFGIAGGFSSLQQVNEEIMPRLYPFLVGHIPKEDFLSFPRTVPANWSALQEQVIEPWLARKLRNGSEIDSLSAEIEKWLRQRPEG